MRRVVLLLFIIFELIAQGMLVYHFFKVNKQNKTSFMIHTYDKELKAAFDFGMSHFWFEKEKHSLPEPLNASIAFAIASFISETFKPAHSRRSKL